MILRTLLAFALTCAALNSSATAQTTAGASPAELVGATPQPTPTSWKTRLYGFVEFDAIHDSTQSFTEASLNGLIAPRGTYLGDHGRTQFTAKNSRIGLLVDAPPFRSIAVSGHINFDFFGSQPTDVTENDFYVVGTMRLRHAYLKLKTPVLDLLAGQHPTLFGWGGAGFYPGTVAFLGVVGQVYHHDAQLRLSRTVGIRAISVEGALAAVRPGQREAEIPDLEAGIRVTHGRWIGRTVQGNDRPEIVPLSVGVSGLSRRFSVAEYRELPKRSRNATGWGLAVNAFVPIIPASSVDDFSNCLTFTGEFSLGTGTADRYSFLTGGARFQALPNPSGRLVPPLYRPNADNGLVTFDADARLKTIDWQAFVLGLQYYVPVPVVRLWVTGLYARLESNNLADLTPQPNHGDIITKAEYVDGSLFVGVTPDVHFGLSLQVTEQTRANGPRPRNVRAHFATSLFF
jgi:hypothetical protein